MEDWGPPSGKKSTSFLPPSDTCPFFGLELPPPHLSLKIFKKEKKIKIYINFDNI